MRIHQLSIRYERDPDRMLGRVNTDTGQELRLWFTRRLTLGLLPQLRRLVNEHDERTAAAQAGGPLTKDPKLLQMLGEFKKDELMRQADFKTPFKEPAPGAALAPAPLLIVEWALNPLPSGNLQMVLRGTLNDTARRDVKLELDGQLMHGFLHLLELAFASSQWTASAVAAIDPAIEPAASGQRPQYLN